MCCDSVMYCNKSIGLLAINPAMNVNNARSYHIHVCDAILCTTGEWFPAPNNFPGQILLNAVTDGNIRSMKGSSQG